MRDSMLHKQDWLASHGPRKLRVLLVMLIVAELTLLMTWKFPVSFRVLFVYWMCITVVMFAHFFSYLRIWKEAQKHLPMLTTDEHQLMFVYTTKCYSIRSFLFSVFWPAFFLPRSSKKREYER